MSRRLVRTLVCDKPSCRAYFVHGTGVRLTPLTVLQHVALAEGWTERNGRHYCPAHKPWPGFAAWVPVTRRAYLLSAIRASGRPVTTESATRLLDGSPWAAGRNTVRKGLRGLARDGHLIAKDHAGRRTYHPTSTTLTGDS